MLTKEFVDAYQRLRDDAVFWLGLISFEQGVTLGTATGPYTPGHMESPGHVFVDRTPGRTIMKKGIHPKYMNTVVKCGCGNSFTTRSTVPEMKVDICNVCHPFYTGKLKFVDTAGRIEKFKSKFAPDTPA